MSVLCVTVLHDGRLLSYCLLQEPGAAPAPKPASTEDDALDDSKFDEFLGNDAGAFASFGEYDQVCTNCNFLSHQQYMTVFRADTEMILSSSPLMPHLFSGL